YDGECARLLALGRVRLRLRMVRALLRGEEPAGHVPASVLLAGGRLRDGLEDADRKDGWRGCGGAPGAEGGLKWVTAQRGKRPANFLESNECRGLAALQARRWRFCSERRLTRTLRNPRSPPRIRRLLRQGRQKDPRCRRPRSLPRSGRNTSRDSSSVFRSSRRILARRASTPRTRLWM